MLYLGDCLEIMPILPAASVDLTVTSPPYDNLRTYNGMDDWNAAKWQAIIAELFRLTKPGGVVVWVVGDQTKDGTESGTSFRQALFAMECGFNLHDTMIYEKSGTGAVGSRLSYWQVFEFMFVFSKGRPKSINLIADRPNAWAGATVSGSRRKKNGDKGAKVKITIGEVSVRTNIWRMFQGAVSDRNGDVWKHPATFPESLAADHISSWSNPNDLIFDPFTGSGTTGKMAALLGRKFTGIERDSAYFEIARKRIQPFPWEVDAASR